MVTIEWRSSARALPDGTQECRENRLPAAHAPLCREPPAAHVVPLTLAELRRRLATAEAGGAGDPESPLRFRQPAAPGGGKGWSRVNPTQAQPCGVAASRRGHREHGVGNGRAVLRGVCEVMGAPLREGSGCCPGTQRTGEERWCVKIAL